MPQHHAHDFLPPLQAAENAGLSSQHTDRRLSGFFCLFPLNQKGTFPPPLPLKFTHLVIYHLRFYCQ
jgi:hypothetical protein